MNFQDIDASASPETQVNENFETIDYTSVYGKRQPVTTGLTWGYYGGRWGGFAITAATLTLTNTATNYIVVLRSTGVISVSTASTNWDNTGLYARVYKLTTAGGVVTATEDHRAGPYGVNGLMHGLSVATGKTLTVSKSMTLTAADDTGVYTFPTGTASIARIDAAQTFAGLQTFSGNIAAPAGTVAAPGLYLSTDTGTGLYRIGANNYGVAVSGAKVLDIASTGLAVTGTLSSSGTVTSEHRLSVGSTLTNDALVTHTSAGGILYHGLDNSVGSFSGTAYSTIVYRPAATPWILSRAGTVDISVSATGAVTIPGLAGTGTRTVVVDANGVMSAP